MSVCTGDEINQTKHALILRVHDWTFLPNLIFGAQGWLWKHLWLKIQMWEGGALVKMQINALECLAAGNPENLPSFGCLFLSQVPHFSFSCRPGECPIPQPLQLWSSPSAKPPRVFAASPLLGSYKDDSKDRRFSKVLWGATTKLNWSKFHLSRRENVLSCT